MTSIDLPLRLKTLAKHVYHILIEGQDLMQWSFETLIAAEAMICSVVSIRVSDRRLTDVRYCGVVALISTS